MKENTKKYWRGVEELNNDPSFLENAHREFPEYVPLKEKEGNYSDETSRRDFLKLLGFGVGAVTLAACEAPVKKAIPYLNKPEDVEPGIANYYASTYVDGGDYCSILVKTREGRPIKIEGNTLSSVTKGGTSARVQAAVLSLYDSSRLQSFLKGGAAVDSKNYANIDAEISSKLAASSSIRIVSQSILSPSTKAVIADFKAKYPSTVHVVYDASSASGILKANQSSFGKSVVPSYDFSKAQVIVSLGADFLGTWISPVEYAGQYAVTRKLGKSKKQMSRHYQFETNLSLTGSNADIREAIRPSQEGLYAAALYASITGTKLNVPAVNSKKIEAAAKDLLNAKGQSLVVSGSNDPSVQILVNEINKALGNYGNTLDIEKASYYRQGDDVAMNTFIDEVKEGKVDAVIFYNANPVFDHPRGAELRDSIQKTVKTRISFNERNDETTSLCEYAIPDNHFLESWGDAMPKAGKYSLMQPTINPVYKTRQAQESLLIWSGNSADYYSYLNNYWKNNILNGASWDKTLHDGVLETGTSVVVADSTAAVSAPVAVSISTSFDQASVEAGLASYKNNADGIELKLYEKVGMGWGSQSANPWLQELPDPISKATWDNYVAMPLTLATSKGLKDGSIVTVKANGKSVDLPVLVQPGQAANTISIAVGYGRKFENKTVKSVGQNAFPFATVANGQINFSAGKVEISATGAVKEMAQTQTHHTIMSRPIIQDATLSDYIKDASAGRFIPLINTPDGKKKPSEVSLWLKEHDKPNHLWQMAIDLNTCIGCGACVISCQAENNVPVVGRDEVVRRREMHWIRIDRYYSSDADPKGKGEDKYFGTDFDNMEIPSENPQVTFQPMLCQHCNHAPCETVCPVAATMHSSEGLNQMAYNRCFGTRYCANNCPYKVRRFNWFKYFDNAERFPENISMNTSMGRMVLNPDVTVRSRGVMEKCSMCVQKIQESKLKAKKEKRAIADGEVQTACSSACPTNAIVFGDVNDLNSKIYNEKNVENKERAYVVLEELNVQPNIHYLTKIRNV